MLGFWGFRGFRSSRFWGLRLVVGGLVETISALGKFCENPADAQTIKNGGLSVILHPFWQLFFADLLAFLQV